MKIHPSIISADLLNLSSAIRDISKHTDTLHFDIEDTSYTSSVTFGPKMLNSIAKEWKGEISVHVMVRNPMRVIQEIDPRTVSTIFIHPHALDLLAMDLTSIMSMGFNVGLAFKPYESMQEFAPIKFVDDIMVMTSDDDGKGSIFNPEMFSKVSLAKECWPKARIWADGGINSAVAKRLLLLGADCIVSGRAFFDNPSEFMEEVYGRK